MVSFFKKIKESYKFRKQQQKLFELLYELPSDIEEFKRTIDLRYINEYSYSYRDESLLYAAITSKEYEIAKWLISNGIDINMYHIGAQDKPLFMIIKSKNFDLFKHILKYKPSFQNMLGYKDNHQDYDIICAICQYGTIEMLRYVVEELKYDRGFKNFKNNDLLYNTTRSKEDEIIKYVVINLQIDPFKPFKKHWGSFFTQYCNFNPQKIDTIEWLLQFRHK